MILEVIKKCFLQESIETREKSQILRCYLVNMDLLGKAKKLLSANTILKKNAEESRNEDIVFTAPSPGIYDQQWFWDSCLHSLVWFKLGNKDRAFKELESLFIGKGQKILFPHMIFWNYKKTNPYWWIFDRLYPTKNYSELIQPPIIGYPLLRLVKENHKKVSNLVQATYQYYMHLFEVRDPEKSGLISIVHPWESGLDSSPKFDLNLTDTKLLRIKQWRRMRGLLKEYNKYQWNQKEMAKHSSFKVKCVLTNTLFLGGMTAFIKALKILNLAKEMQNLQNLKNTVTNSLIEKCWNDKDGLFYDLDMNNQDNPQIKVSTISSLLPLMLDIPLDMKDRLIDHLTNKNEYWAKYPVPTVSMTEKSFNPKDSPLLWRGPTWINTNYFIWLGLKKQEEIKLADDLAKKSKELVIKSGFREFYNPITGEGAGAENFGWSTLVVLME